MNRPVGDQRFQVSILSQVAVNADRKVGAESSLETCSGVARLRADFPGSSIPSVSLVANRRLVGHRAKGSAPDYSISPTIFLPP